MSRRVPQLLVALVALFGLVAVVIGVQTRGSTEPSPRPPASADPAVEDESLSPDEEAERASARFLERYVGDDGRVRRDDPADTVSEGQAYGMLLSVALGDAEAFARIWSWTSTNLVGPSGTLAWHWLDGSVVDPNAATDADLDVIRALLLATDRFSTPAYRTDALVLAEALRAENVVMRAGTPVLAAGPWATTEPVVINPSYHSTETYSMLASASGDPVWSTLGATGTELLSTLTDDGSRLPSDWATVDGGGAAQPAREPGAADDAEPRYGYDAFRTLVRLAESCDPDARTLAAALARPTTRAADADANVTDLDGASLETGDNPLFLVAAAGAAAAAGDEERTNELLDEAERLERAAPSYYLGAWVALGRVLLETDRLGGCSTLDDLESAAAGTVP